MILLKWLKNLFEKTGTTGKKPTKVQYAVLIGLVGIFILLVSQLFDTKDNTSPSTPNPLNDQPDVMENDAWKQNNTPDSDKTASITELEKSYAKELENLLNMITGVSDTEVMINIDATAEQVYQTNLIVGTQVTNEEDQNGGTRKIDDETREQNVVIIRKGDEEIPLLIQTKKPSVRGVLVVAKGVDNLEIKRWIVDAVAKVLDVPEHRISVMPKSS